MKVKRIFLRSALLLFGASCFVCSCQQSTGDQSQGDEALAWDSVVVDTTAMLTDDAHGPKAEIHLNIKYASGKKASNVNDSLIGCGLLSPDYLAVEKDKSMTVPEAVRLFVRRYVADYVKDYGALYAKDKEHGASYNLQYSCNTSVAMPLSGIVNYVAEVYSFAGGAHGMNITIAKNFDAATGKMMKLSDVFVPGYEEGLKELIVKELCAKLDAKDLEQLQQKGVFVGMEPYVPDNFIVGDGQVTFVYCDTEIAPHAVGELRVDLKGGEVKKLMKSE